MGVPAQSHDGLCGPLQVAGGLQPLLRPRATESLVAMPSGLLVRSTEEHLVTVPETL